jgi:hypothetical protein
MNFTATYLLTRCDWNNKSRALMFTHLLRTSPPALQIFAVKVSVVVAVILTTGDVDLSTTTEEAIPISPRMQHLLDLPAKFVASPDIQQSIATTDRTNLSRLNSPSCTSRPIPKVITPHPYCQLKNFGILIPVQLTISPAIFRIST